MTTEQLINYAIQLGILLFAAGGFVTAFKLTFKHHEKILAHHEKILDKHDKAIDKILDRLDAMNTEIGYMKGWIMSRENK